MAKYTDVPLYETTDSEIKDLYPLLNEDKSKGYLRVAGARIDAYLRAYIVEKSTLDDSNDIDVGYTVLLDKSSPELPSTDSITCKVRLSNESGEYYEVAVQYNVPYLKRCFMYQRTFVDGDGTELGTGKNFNSNNWSDSKFSITLTIKEENANVNVNGRWDLSTVVNLPDNLKYIYKIVVYRTANESFSPKTIPSHIKDKLNFGEFKSKNVTHSFYKVLLEPHPFSFLFVEDDIRNSYVEAKKKKPMVVTAAPIPADNVEIVEKLKDLSSVEEIIESRGRALLNIPNNVFHIKEEDTYDDRFLDKSEAFKVNQRLRALAVKLGFRNSSSGLATFLTAVIQLFVLYSTVKNIDVKEQYFVTVRDNNRDIDVKYADVRKCIVGGDYDFSDTNYLRRFMRYLSNTTVQLLLNNFIVPSYVASAKHGVPKKFLPYCFDFAVLDSRHYTTDVLKANAMSCAYAIKFANLKQKRSETYSLYDIN